MRKVVVREYDWLGTMPESDFPVVLSHSQVGTLVSMERTWAKGTLEWGRGKVRFAGFCGTVKLGTDYFDILPKVTVEKDHAIDLLLLVRMLRIVTGLSLSTGDVTQVSMQNDSVLDVLIDLFCRTIRDSARRGLPHDYTMHSDDLRALRGKLSVSKQLQHNLCHPEKIACDFEEFQEDNALNHILKAGLIIACRHAGSSSTRVFVQSVLDLFIDVTDVPVSQLRWAGLEQDRRFAGWKSALAQARWFIEGECPNIYSGQKDSISILFDMARLFERYVAIEVSSILNPEGYSIRCQGPHHWILFSEGKVRYKTIPDIFISKDARPIAVLDTKWKVLVDGADDSGIAQGDLYQLFTYAKAYHVTDVALIYPSTYGKAFEYGHWWYMDKMTSLHIIRVDLATLCRGRQYFRDELARAGLDRVLAGVGYGFDIRAT